MRIYISSSWKNRERVRVLAERLRKIGCAVYDFTDPRCRLSPEIPPEKFPEQFDPENHVYHEYLDRDEWRTAVEGNRAAIEWADAVLLMLPCGIDSTADWALGVGLAKKSLIIGHPPAGQRSPVHLWADALVETDAQAERWVYCQKGFHARQPWERDVPNWEYAGTLHKLMNAALPTEEEVA